MLGKRRSLSNDLTCLGPRLTRTEEPRSAHSGLLLTEPHGEKTRWHPVHLFFFSLKIVYGDACSFSTGKVDKES